MPGETIETVEGAAVTAAVEHLRVAMLSGDRTALSDLVDDCLTYGHGNGRLENKAQFIDGVVDANFTSLRLRDQTITILEGCALVRLVMTAERPHAPAGNAGRELGVLLVLMRRGRQWKLVARQAVVLGGKAKSLLFLKKRCKRLLCRCRGIMRSRG